MSYKDNYKRHVINNKIYTESVDAEYKSRNITIFFIDDGVSILDNWILKDLNEAYKELDFITYLQYKELFKDV